MCTVALLVLIGASNAQWRFGCNNGDSNAQGAYALESSYYEFEDVAGQGLKHVGQVE